MKSQKVYKLKLMKSQKVYKLNLMKSQKVYKLNLMRSQKVYKLNLMRSEKVYKHNLMRSQKVYKLNLMRSQKVYKHNLMKSQKVYKLNLMRSHKVYKVKLMKYTFSTFTNESPWFCMKLASTSDESCSEGCVSLVNCSNLSLNTTFVQICMSNVHISTFSNESLWFCTKIASITDESCSEG